MAANRANAQKSSGPKTDAGKQRSSLNALRHGLTAQVTVMSEHERAAFEAFAAPLIDSLGPESPMETQLAVTVATWQWRLNRAAAIEEGIFTVGTLEWAAENLQQTNPEVHNALSNIKTYCKSPSSFDRLSLYSHRLMAQSDRALKQLKQLQAERKANEQEDLDRAILLQRYHDAEGLPFDPPQNGFVYSAAALRTLTDRKIMMERANLLANPDSSRRRTKPQPQKAAA